MIQLYMKMSKQVMAAVLVGTLALGMRLPGLGSFMTVDEENWTLRSQGFYHNLLVNHDPGGTFMTTHPGATAMWLIGAGMSVQASRLGATLPMAITTSFLIGLASWFLVKLFGVFPGFVAGSLLAVEPYLVGMSQIAHLDMLLALFMLNSVLVFLIYQRPVVGVGGLAGLALATKLLPALWLFAFFGLFLVWKYRWQISEIIRQLGFIFGVAMLVFYVTWPALWFTADLGRSFAKDVPYVIREAHVAVDDSQEPIAPGSFYVRTVLARTTPFILILTFAAVLAKKKPPLSWLLLYAFSFLIFITLAAKKADRYALPALVMLPVIAGASLPILRSRIVKWGAGIAILLLTIQAVLWVPYTIAYNNPIFNIRPLPQQGWGEGLDVAAAWLNGQPDAENVHVASWYSAVMRNYFHGKTLSLSSRHDDRVGYVVLYRNMFGRSAEDAATTVIEEFQNQKPAHMVEIQGVPQVWVYDTRGLYYFPNHIGELFGEKTVGQIIPMEKNNWETIEVGLSTFSSRNNTQDLILHVREGIDAKEDIRTVKINAREIQDSSYHRFEFEPITDSAGKTYYVFLRSPTSRAGDAVTVRFANQDLLPGEMVKNGAVLPGRDVAYRIPKQLRQQ